MTHSESPAQDAATALLAGLIAHGVQDVVLAPGSRSQALALAALHFSGQDAVRLHVRIDERVAAFTALGLARETRTPAVVVCTSGTAAANFLPAAMEAFHAGVPLLLVTADRPPELRGKGANQATVQPGMFDPWSRLCVDAPTAEGQPAQLWHDLARDAVRAALGSRGQCAAPVHLNLPYREPLSAPVQSGEAPEASPAAPAPEVPYTEVLARGPRTVVIAGADAGPDAEETAHRGGWPLIAEIVSGARFGRNLVHGYRELLHDEALGGSIQRAVVFGHPTLSREVAALLSRRDVEVIAVRCGGEELNLNGHSITVDACEVAQGQPDREWLGAWMRESAVRTPDLSEVAPDADGLSSKDPLTRAGAVKAELAAIRRPIDRTRLVDAVWRATWPHDRLMFGSSRLVRVADQVLPGKKVPVHANRGLAGIDGTVSTALGIALASQAEGALGVTRVLLGDLAFLHDVGALHLPADEVAPRIQVIVGNDGGGTIFDGLEVAQRSAQVDLDRAFYTPQRVSLEALATAYGWGYVRAATRSELDQVLTTPPAGPQLIEVPLDR